MPEDSLDIEVFSDLLAWLRQTGRIEADETPHLVKLTGGVSNRTVLLNRPNGQAWVMKQALAKLRVAADWFSDPRRIGREAAGMRHLQFLAPPESVPSLVFEDSAHHLLAMTAVAEPHVNWKTVLLAGKIDPDHIDQFGRLIGTIHRRSWQGADTLSTVFDDRSFFESLRVEPYYLYSADQVPPAARFLHNLIADVRGRRLSLVHGDYSPKNILVHADRLILLDHEVIHFGDPAFDLGFSLTHLLSKGHHLPAHRGDFAAAALRYWTAYRRTLGDVPWAGDLEGRVVRHTLGCLLARVAGRSPLEYLSSGERGRQRDRVVKIMQNPPAGVIELVQSFLR